MIMDRATVIKLLFKYGWTAFTSLPDALSKMTDAHLEIIRRLYAAFHGLSSASDVQDHLLAPRFCNLPDTMPVTVGGRCKWPDNNVTWDVQQWPQAFQKQQMVECIREAMRRWAVVCGINPIYAPGDPNARIVVGTRSIDGAMGVLAESELPCGNVRQCHQWYDTGENWRSFDGAGQGGSEIDLIRVATHELGHALGMNHIGAGNLLAPTYSLSVWTPQAGDIQEMQARYGPPTQTPTPSAPPTPAGQEDYILRFTGGKLAVDGYRLTKMAG